MVDQAVEPMGADPITSSMSRKRSTDDLRLKMRYSIIKELW